VVVYRFWHSTTAYAVAEECPEVPRTGHDVYRWPADLTKPSLVILLVVSEDERRRRIAGRPLRLTDEETQLAEDAEKRERSYDLLFDFNTNYAMNGGAKCRKWGG